MRRYFYTVIFFIWASSVVWNASRPQKEFIVEFPHFDKFMHVVYYIPGGYFCFLFLRSFGGTSIPLSFSMGITIGIIDEFIQSFVPEREPDFMDLLADILGLIIGIVLARWRASLPTSSDR